jgi:hypothetical protein
MRTQSYRTIAACALIALASLATHLAYFSRIDLRSPLSSDGFYYLSIARELASGRGYVDPWTYWGDRPSFGRAPGWPFVLSLFLRIFRGVEPDLLARLVATSINLLAAITLFIAARRAFRSAVVGLLAGIGYAIHPHAVYLASLGLSEPLFVLLAVAGTALVLKGGYLPMALGGACFGMAALARVNFLLFPLAVAALGACRWFARPRGRPDRRRLAAMAVALACFSAPPLGWATRNYHLCGHFPVFSSIRGETFYGSNNDVVANSLQEWGYWIFPDLIPGAPVKQQLASGLGEYELDRYYYNAGKEWIRAHWLEMPRLILGKLIRAYVPMPWAPSAGAFAAAAYRLALYLLFAAAIYLRVRPALPAFGLLFWGMMLVNLATVVVFYGCARFTFAVEPFMAPYAAAALIRGGRADRAGVVRVKGVSSSSNAAAQAPGPLQATSASAG